MPVVNRLSPRITRILAHQPVRPAHCCASNRRSPADLMRSYYESLPPIIVHMPSAQAPAPMQPVSIPEVRPRPAMVSVSCQSGESFMPLAHVPTRWERTWSKMLAIGDALAQFLARVTPRVTLAVGIYPTIPDHWPAIFQRQR